MGEPHAEENGLPVWLSVGFTGHRAIANPQVVSQAIREALTELCKLNPRLCGVSSAAAGADTLFVQAVERAGHPFTIVLPFGMDRFEKDFAGDPDGWNQCRILVGKAVHVDVVHPPDPIPFDLGAGEVQTSASIAADNQVYMETGCRTVDRADVLLAVWDGQESHGFGGTADVVRYAISLDLPLIIINPADGSVIRERLEKLAELETDPTQGQIIENPRQIVQDQFTTWDRLASVHGNRARGLIKLCLWMHLAAATVVVFGVTFHTMLEQHHWTTPAISIVDLFVIGFAIWLLIKRRHSYETWFKARGRTEVCRSFLATWDIRRHASFAHRPHPGLPGMKRVWDSLRMLRQLDTAPLLSFEQARVEYDRNRLLAQANYFESEYENANRKYVLLKRMMKLSSSLAGACAVLVFVYAALGFFHGAELSESNVRTLAEFFAITLPLGTTALGLMQITDESSRRVIRYKEMIKVLKFYRPRLQSCRTWDSLARLAVLIEDEILQELLEWQSFVRHTEDVA